LPSLLNPCTRLRTYPEIVWHRNLAGVFTDWTAVPHLKLG